MGGESAWIARFRHITARDAIRKRAAITPTPVIGLERLPIVAAQDALDGTLRELFVVTERVLDILQLYVDRAVAFCARVYPSERLYVNRLFTMDWPQDHESAILMTGPAGSGKSQLARALLRALPTDDEVFVGGAVQRKMPLEATAYIAFKSQASPRTALAPWLPIDALRRTAESGSVGVPTQPKLSDSRVIELVRFEFFRRGIVTAIGDEYQFLTQSAGANAKLARMLLTMIYLSVPVTNILNYSGCHKLVRRPHEERDRILANIVHVVPEAPDSDDWKQLLTAYDKLLEPVLAFRMAESCEPMWILTAASKRTLRRLITLGYRIAREAGRAQIGLGDLECAYRTLEFAALRADVDATVGMLSRGVAPKGRDDLWCPFGNNDWYKPTPEASSQRLIEADIAVAFVKESLPPEQRLELARLQAAGSESERRSNGMRSGRGRKKVDSATLLRNAAAHRASVKR